VPITDFDMLELRQGLELRGDMRLDVLYVKSGSSRIDSLPKGSERLHNPGLPANDGRWKTTGLLEQPLRVGVDITNPSL